MKNALGVSVALLAMLDGRVGFGQSGAIPTEPSQEVQLLSAARNEPVEIEAYVYRRLREQGRPIPAKLAKEVILDLRQRAATADTWLPAWPATSHLSAGYSALAASSKFGLSGLDIFLSTFTLDKDTPPVAIKRMIAEFPRGSSQAPTCELPVFSSRIPLYRYLSTHGKQLYGSRGEQLALLSDLAATVDSVYEVASFADFVSSFEFKDSTDFPTAQSQVANVLARVEMPPCGGETLFSQFGFTEALNRVVTPPAARGEPSAGLLLAYRSFAVRAIKRPICTIKHQPDAAESAARRRLTDAVNRQIEVSQLKGMAVISPEDVKRYEFDRELVDQDAPAFPMADTVQKALFGLREYFQNPSLGAEKPAELSAALDDFVYQWRLWDPASGNNDFRNVDAKVLAMETLCRFDLATACRKAMPELVAYLSDHRLRREHPALWLAYAMRLLEVVYRTDAGGQRLQPDPAVVAAIDHALDPALRLIVGVR